MKNRFGQDSTFLLGGALLGAAAMYLLDPDTGNRRRRRVAKAAQGAYGTAKRAVNDEMKHVSDVAKDMTHRLVAKAHDMQGDVAGYAQNLADEARNLASDLTDHANSYLKDKQSQAGEYQPQVAGFGSQLLGRAQDAYAAAQRKLHEYTGAAADSAQGYMRHAHDAQGDLSRSASHLGDWFGGRAKQAAARTRSALGYKEESRGHGGWIASGAVGTLALGAGAMYFFDPARGSARRSQVGRMVSHCVQQTGAAMNDLGTRVANSCRGAAHQARAISERYIHEFNGEELIERASQAVAHLTETANRIRFMVERDGTLTVTGNLAREAMDEFLIALHKVPGVSHVINRLEILAKTHQPQASQPEPSQAPGAHPQVH